MWKYSVIWVTQISQSSNYIRPLLDWIFLTLKTEEVLYKSRSCESNTLWIFSIKKTNLYVNLKKISIKLGLWNKMHNIQQIFHFINKSIQYVGFFPSTFGK